MSGTASINPPPEVWSGLQPGEQRVKSASLKPLLQAPDTLYVTPTVTIARQDGTPMTASDMTVVGNPELDSTSLIVSAVLQGGTLAPVDYAVTVGATGNQTGRPYFRTVYISTILALG